jgi:hypothetical protein
MVCSLLFITLTVQPVRSDPIVKRMLAVNLADCLDILLERPGGKMA